MKRYYVTASLGLCFIFHGLTASGQTVDSVHVSPLQQPSLSTSHEFAWKPGVFGHTFGYAGWTDGIAPMGTDPNRVPVRVGNLRFNDGFTGIPRLDIVPVTWLETLSLSPNLSIEGSFDSLASGTPFTLVRYESSGSGGQAVRTLHVQNRTVKLGSTTAKLQTAFGYAGASGTGEYDGSALRRGREVSARIALNLKNWSVQLFDVASRKRVGAHGGVLPINGASPSSIYQRLGATVQDENARRRSLRNDFTLSGATTVRGYDATIAGIWTKQTLDFGDDSIREKGVLSSIGTEATFSRLFEQVAFLQRFQVELQLASHRESVVSGTIYGDELPSARSWGSAELRVNGTAGSAMYAVSAGPGFGDGRSWGVFDASAALEKGAFRAQVAAHRAGRRLTWHERDGFGSVVTSSLQEPNKPIEQFVSTTISWLPNLFSFFWTGLIERNTDLLVSQLGPDQKVATVLSLPGTASATVMSMEIGFRDRTSKGIWAKLNPVLRSTSTDQPSDLATAWKESMPSSWASVSLGWKSILFDGDLDLNVYLRARAWSEMGGLRLHTPTGILALPNDPTERVDANWLVDFVAEAGIRDAIIFFSRENFLSGTTLLYGNTIIPDYPLAEQRTRFGVYWPISN